MLSLHASLLQNRNQATAAAPEHSSTVPAFDSLFSDASPGDNSEEATGAQKMPLREPVDIQRNQNRDQATAPAPEHSSAAPACNSLSHDASPEDDSELDKRDCQASHSESVDHLPDQVGAHSSVFTCVFVSRPPRCSAWSQTHASVLSKGTQTSNFWSASRGVQTEIPFETSVEIQASTTLPYEADIPGHQGTSPEGGGQSRPWCSSPPCGIIPTPLEFNLTTELLGPEADPLDTGDESSDFNESEETSTEPDTSYRPNDSVNSSYGADSSDTSDDSVTSDDGRPHEECNVSAEAADPLMEKKYLVCASKLLELFSICKECLAPTETKLKQRGTLLHAVTTCVRGHTTVWENQPTINGKALMNIVLPAAITYSGASPTRVLRLLGSIAVAVIHKTQFFKVQRCLVFPAATKVWKTEQTVLLTSICGTGLHLAGDGRADSPGYSAKYGTYSLLETNINKILHYEVVQSNEVKSSNHMETEGLKRSFDYLQGWGFFPDVLVTDRHFGVSALMKDSYPNTKHRFDAWHIAKGIGSKLATAGKTKRNSILNNWVKTVRAHVYWCAQTSNDNGAMVLAKWKSLMRHVLDVHQHPDPMYPACTHASIEDRWWLLEGSEPYIALEKVVMSHQLLKDIPRISGDGQTYRLESFHSLLIRFTPKSTHFTVEGMAAR
ncbi:uncharacterized protein LOC115323759 [Ixodes scapularis]|uniref:uncharacterized protein LOC115323759 n=1 Tax=Ixodes scapularis TaxID=6945 RepID=UPI001C3820AE|nr:uncharacterized protein LOC115323759 [Ixodes scapularis]